MKRFLNELFKVYVYLVLVFVLCALTFDGYMIYLHFSNQDQKMREIGHEFDIRFDGNYKDNPKNIWYEKSN